MNLASKPKPAQNSRVYIWLPLEAPSDKRRGESYSRNPKPETRKPKPETRNSKPPYTIPRSLVLLLRKMHWATAV